MRKVLERKELTLNDDPEFQAYDAGFADGWNACLEREFNANGRNAPPLPDKKFHAIIKKCFNKWWVEREWGVKA